MTLPTPRLAIVSSALPSLSAQGHYEWPPYNPSTMRSAYHVRELEVGGWGGGDPGAGWQLGGTPSDPGRSTRRLQFGFCSSIQKAAGHAAAHCARAPLRLAHPQPTDVPVTKPSPRNPLSLRLQVHRLLRLRQPVDVFLSHDWPQGIARHGDTARLLQRKAFLRGEVGGGAGEAV